MMDRDSVVSEIILNKVQSLRVSDSNLVIFDINKLLGEGETTRCRPNRDDLDLQYLKMQIPEIHRFIISHAENHSSAFYKIKNNQPLELITDIVESVEESTCNELDDLKDDNDKMVCTSSDTFGVYYYEELINSPRVKSNSMEEFSEMYEAIVLKNFKGEVALWDVTNLEGSTWKFLVGIFYGNPAESFVLIMDDYVLYSE